MQSLTTKIGLSTIALKAEFKSTLPTPAWDEAQEGDHQ
jgi:hypothetical protein